jgi:hypothetical protein
MVKRMSDEPDKPTANGAAAKPGPETPPAPAAPAAAPQAPTDSPGVDQEPSQNSKNRASDVHNSTVNQAGRDVHNHGIPYEEYSKIYEAGFKKGREHAPDESDHRRHKEFKISRQVQIPVQQQPPKNAQEYADQFEVLSNEDKLFITLLRLFPDVAWIHFWEIYDSAAEAILPKPVLKTEKGKDEKDEEEERSPPPRFRSETYWARIAHAAVSLTTKTYVEGHSTQTTINFASTEVRVIIEQTLSTYHRQWLFRMLPVLRMLGGHSNIDIRRLVAKATAVLADIDWAYVQREIIEPWSRDIHDDTRTTVAYAFDAIMASTINDGHVVFLLHRWSNPDDLFYWRQCWTAAFAYRLIGKRRFDMAKQDLRSLAILADTILNKYYLDGQGDSTASKNEIEQADQQLMNELPREVFFTLVNLALEGNAHEILKMLHEWLVEPIPKGQRRLILQWIVLNTLADISYLTLKRKHENQPLPSDFFTLLHDDQNVRKCLADILINLSRQNPENRRSIQILLQEWIEQLVELKLDTDPVGRVIIHMFRRFDATYRERLLRSLQAWAKHKNSAVRERGAAVVHKLLTTDYPLPPPIRASPSETSGTAINGGRIVFGQP